MSGNYTLGSKVTVSGSTSLNLLNKNTKGHVNAPYRIKVFCTAETIVTASWLINPVGTQYVNGAYANNIGLTLTCPAGEWLEIECTGRLVQGLTFIVASGDVFTHAYYDGTAIDRTLL